MRPESATSALSIAESEYRYIPNNFKKDGVAFNSTKINFDAGISGIYNMGNTCFMSTGMFDIHFLKLFSCSMSECCAAFNRFFHCRSPLSFSQQD